MLQEKIFSTLAVAAVILITAGFFIAAEPEESSVSTTDGVVTVTGLTRQTQPLAVALDAAVQTPLLGNAYAVTPDGVTLDEPVVIAFNLLPDQLEDIANLGVYKFHPSLLMWERVSPIVAHTDELLAVETGQLGKFALGDVPTFEPPVFANVYDELRAKAPADAVGYEIAVGYTAPEQETVRLFSTGESGGCGGAVRVGDTESLSRLERQATVSIGDKTETLTFVFVTRWFTSSSGGCAVTEPLRPLSEYDILDEIQI